MPRLPYIVRRSLMGTCMLRALSRIPSLCDTIRFCSRHSADNMTISPVTGSVATRDVEMPHRWLVRSMLSLGMEWKFFELVFYQMAMRGCPWSHLRWLSLVGWSW
jgi:hypothetical protein